MQTDDFIPDMVTLVSKIKVFNKIEGEVLVGYPSGTYTKQDFLIEEQTLLNKFV
ncbi:hypothetical protein [Maribacter sp. 1_MG-2023]|uniref:hypothetical protein n=1 Tax=Maribacter sp. 1_MG-2023 TaxID=3062677 RepID=UPI0026E44925|nr:hypothetical protein [Maribacter sp. 1_MG-2023]MDO6470684.1 hypothetical protein [Maribacter sp. 1_MG-2023]